MAFTDPNTGVTFFGNGNGTIPAELGPPEFSDPTVTPFVSLSDILRSGGSEAAPVQTLSDALRSGANPPTEIIPRTVSNNLPEVTFLDTLSQFIAQTAGTVVGQVANRVGQSGTSQTLPVQASPASQLSLGGLRITQQHLMLALIALAAFLLLRSLR